MPGSRCAGIRHPIASASAWVCAWVPPAPRTHCSVSVGPRSVPARLAGLGLSLPGRLLPEPPASSSVPSSVSSSVSWGQQPPYLADIPERLPFAALLKGWAGGCLEIE